MRDIFLPEKQPNQRDALKSLKCKIFIVVDEHIMCVNNLGIASLDVILQFPSFIDCTFREPGMIANYRCLNTGRNKFQFRGLKWPL